MCLMLFANDQPAVQSQKFSFCKDICFMVRYILLACSKHTLYLAADGFGVLLHSIHEQPYVTDYPTVPLSSG